MILLLGCLLAQMVLSHALPSAWWTPDLLAAGLVLGVLKRPARWLALSVAAGLCAVAWAIRAPEAICLSYVALALAVRAAIRQWDLSDRRAQCALVGVASGVLTSLAIWLDNLWSLPVAGLMLMRAMVTGLTVRWLQQRRLLS